MCGLKVEKDGVLSVALAQGSTTSLRVKNVFWVLTCSYFNTLDCFQFVMIKINSAAVYLKLENTVSI